MRQQIRLSIPILAILALTQCGPLSNSVSNTPPIAFDRADTPSSTSLHTTDGCDPDGRQASGAEYRLCVPAGWVEGQSDLLVYVPGYQSPFAPVEIPDDQLQPSPDDPSLPEIFNELGYGFATTSFASNGLINGADGIPDLLDLVDIFEQTYGEPGTIYIFGVSLGTIVVAQLLEQGFPRFEGGLLGCGPLGNFQAQLNYVGDVRVLFDYYFPSVLPGNLVDVPQEVRDNWDNVYVPRIEAAFLRDSQITAEFLRVANVPSQGQDLVTLAEAVTHVLFFTVFGFEDAIERIGGLAYDNRSRFYRGSSNDVQLNRQVARFAADPGAFESVQRNYQTTAEFSVPLVTLHTLADPTVLYQQEIVYRRRIRLAGNETFYRNIPSISYGHCAFSLPSFVAAFAILVRQVSYEPLAHPERVLRDPQDLATYRQVLREFDPDVRP